MIFNAQNILLDIYINYDIKIENIKLIYKIKFSYQI